MSYRKRDILRFYDLIDLLSNQTDGPIYLSSCHGRMEWPHRGVYFFFEDGEILLDENERPRITRIGTHALKSGSKASLWQRLSSHKGSQRSGGGNHRGSIFRLLVGEALINKNSLVYPEWGKGNNAPRHIKDQEQPLEKLVSEYIGCMPFLCLEINDEPSPKSLRGYIERNSIALLSNFGKPALYSPSENWLGHWSNRERVRKSGLWNQNHVNENYDPGFLDVLENLIKSGLTQIVKPQTPETKTVTRPSMKSVKKKIPSRTNNTGKSRLVISCAASKMRHAGKFRCIETDREILFLAHPDLMSPQDSVIYARPDDISPNGVSWRQALVDYNRVFEKTGKNPFGLLPAYQLYRHHCYKQLVDTFGAERVFILSAGWGLVNANTLLPDYNITFSNQAQKAYKRHKREHYYDINELPDDNNNILFIGGKDYIPLFCDLMINYSGEKQIVYNSIKPPSIPHGFSLHHYQTDCRTNWHYQFADRLISGTLSKPDR